jgi:hypothetical protein
VTVVPFFSCVWLWLVTTPDRTVVLFGPGPHWYAENFSAAGLLITQIPSGARMLVEIALSLPSMVVLGGLPPLPAASVSCVAAVHGGLTSARWWCTHCVWCNSSRCTRLVDGRCALLLPSRGPEAGTRRPVSDAGAMLFCARRPSLFSIHCAVAASPLRLLTRVLLRLLLSPILTGAMRWPKWAPALWCTLVAQNLLTLGHLFYAFISYANIFSKVLR